MHEQQHMDVAHIHVPQVQQQQRRAMQAQHIHHALTPCSAAIGCSIKAVLYWRMWPCTPILRALPSPSPAQQATSASRHFAVTVAVDVANQHSCEAAVDAHQVRHEAADTAQNLGCSWRVSVHSADKPVVHTLWAGLHLTRVGSATPGTTVTPVAEQSKTDQSSAP